MRHEYPVSATPNEMQVTFDELPAIKPCKISTQKKRFFAKIKSMATPRKYELVNHWDVEIKNFTTVENHTHTLALRIPKNTIIDGASVPAPWVIACLSLGILRPMGILFTASVVHDYAFRYGSLPYAQPRKNYFQRHNADKLFKEMTALVNQAPIAAFLAWCGVRIGAMGFSKKLVTYVSHWDELNKPLSHYKKRKRKVLNGKTPPLLLYAFVLIAAALMVITLFNFVAFILCS